MVRTKVKKNTRLVLGKLSSGYTFYFEGQASQEVFIRGDLQTTGQEMYTSLSTGRVFPVETAKESPVVPVEISTVEDGVAVFKDIDV